MAYLKLNLTHEEGERNLEIPDGEEFIIGRGAYAALIIRDDELLSKRHCSILITKLHNNLKDLESRNGTFVNGNHIENYHLQDGDVIKVGGNNILTFYD